MHLSILFILLLFPLASKSETESDKIILQTLDPDVNLNSLPDEHYEKRLGLPEIPSLQHSLPSTDELNKIFKITGLVKETQIMNQLERDILYRKALEWDLEDLEKAYPKVDKEKLRRLTSEIRKP